MSNSETALVTGASSGIGFHLAREFASHGHPLVLVAQVEAELQALGAKLTSAYGVTVRTIAKNLKLENSAQEIFDELAQANVQVDILVNNAGCGFLGRWWKLPIEKDISMVRLNIEAVLRLSKLFLEPMIGRGRGRILNTASVAGFEPGPLLAVYHATKAFVLSWSEALAVELEETSITVTALCPGPTDTDFFIKAGMVDTRAFQGAHLMAPQDVAKAGYEGLMKGELLIVPGVLNKAMVAARRVLSESTQAKANKKLYEPIPTHKQNGTRGGLSRVGKH